MEAKASSRDASMKAPSFSCFFRSASATMSRWASASALLFCAKTVLSIAAGAVRCLAGACAGALRIQ